MAIIVFVIPAGLISLLAVGMAQAFLPGILAMAAYMILMGVTIALIKAGKVRFPASLEPLTVVIPALLVAPIGAMIFYGILSGMFMSAAIKGMEIWIWLIGGIIGALIGGFMGNSVRDILHEELFDRQNSRRSYLCFLIVNAALIALVVWLMLSLLIKAPAPAPIEPVANMAN